MNIPHHPEENLGEFCCGTRGAHPQECCQGDQPQNQLNRKMGGHMSQYVGSAAKCDVDHIRAWKVPAFRPDGVRFVIEQIMGVTYVETTWAGPCPRCGLRIRTPEPVTTSVEPLLYGPAYVIASHLSDHLAE